MHADRCVIIAEAGVNHDGSVEKALALVDVAADAGADWVKFQTFSADRRVTKTAKKAQYQEVATGAGETQYAMLRRLELSEAAHVACRDRAQARGIGAIDPAKVKDFHDKMVKSGLFKAGEVDLSKVYTTEFVNKGVGVELSRKLSGKAK